MLTIVEIVSIVISLILSSYKPIFLLLYLTPLFTEIMKDRRITDEMVRHYRKVSGNVTLSVFTLLLILYGVFSRGMSFQDINLLLFAAFIVKNLVAVQGYMPPYAILKWVGGILGTGLLLFAFLSHGLSVEGIVEFLPGFVVLLGVFLSGRLKKLSAGLFFSLAAFFFFMFIKKMFVMPKITPGLIFGLFVSVFLPIYLGIQSLREEEEL